MPLKKRVVPETVPPLTEAPAPDETPIDSSVRTVNGQPIPAHLLQLIPYANTDQGIAEANLRRVEPSGVKVTSDAWDKTMDKRANATELWESEDPMLDAVNSVREAGMSYKLLSHAMIQKRGKRRYEIVKGENGDPVSVGNMVLGKMPEELKDKRNRHYQEKGNQELREARMNLTNEVEKAKHDKKGHGISGLAEGEVVNGREHSVAMGMERTRGALSE